MELLPLVCFCLLICSGTTFGDEVIEMRVNEDEDVILPCSLDSTNIRTETFDWKKDDQKNVFQYVTGFHYNNGRGGQDPQFKGRVFHFEDQLQSGNASIVIRKTKKTDTGSYNCIFPFHQPKIRSIIELLVVIKMRVKEDEDVILPCSLDSTNIRTETFDWKKDNQKDVFLYVSGFHYNNGRSGQDPQFKGRVFHFEDQLQSGNASIVIRKSKMTDSGNYRCIFPFHQPRIRSIIELIVVIKMRVKEDEDVILPCSLDSTNIRTDVFVWKKDDQNVFQYNAGNHPNNNRTSQDQQFKGRVFHFEDQLQSGNASIVIRNTTYKDSGYYSCIFPYHQPKIRSTIELIVDCILKDRTEEKIEGSCPEPSVTILDDTKDWALLQCKVQIQDGFPKPKVQWLDSEKKTVPVTNTTKGKYIILNATVTKSDVYRCVSTQEEICHQIDQRIKVSLPDKDPGSSTGLIIGLAVVSVIAVVLAVVVFLLCKKQKSNRSVV